jgi:acyl-CoA reductase-like NAD-dependent aldehyde dehydrogenase
MRKLWINGDFIDSGLVHERAINPANEETIGEFVRGTVPEAENAVAAAKSAFMT